MVKGWTAIATSFLLATPTLLFALNRPAIAQTAPGVTIENTATGSFLDTSTNQTEEIFSNTVTVQVIEVAGIGVVAQTPIEASLAEAETIVGTGNAGAYQGFDGVNTDDLVFFDFVVTNLGNDPTAFYLPVAPSTVTGGTFNSATAPMQIIAIDPDGTGTDYAEVTNLNGSGGAVNVTAAGTTTTLLGATNGYIPAGGTVTVRVPIIVTATTVGNPINVVLGETVAVGDQNQDYAANTNDLYTVDLADNTTNPYTTPATINEATGAPTPEKEASAQGSVNVAAAYQLKGYKSVALTTDTNSNGTVNEGETITWTIYYVNTGTGNLTDLQITDDIIPTDADLSYTAGDVTIQTGNTTNGLGTALTLGSQPTENTAFDGNTNQNIFATPLPTLVPGEFVRVDIPVTINTTGVLPRQEENQASASGNRDGGTAIAPVLTDNVDDIPLETLPSGVVIPAGSITQNEDANTIVPTVVDIVAVGTTARDYGDAPDTGAGTGTGNYQTTLSSGGASQAVSPTLRLGVEADPDSGTLQNSTANADDNDNLDDEDGVVSLPYLTTKAGLTYSVPVEVTNSSGANAYLRGYLDFNRDGDFADANEVSNLVTVPSSTTNPQTVQVLFTSPTGLTNGTTYARFRLSSVESDVNSPVGASNNPGEIEDYAVSINTFGTPPPLSCATSEQTFVWGTTSTAPNYYSYSASTTAPPEAIYVNISDSLDLRLSFAGNLNLLTNQSTLGGAIVTSTALFDGGRNPAEPSLNLNIRGTANSFVRTNLDFLDKVDGVNDGTLVEIENVNFTIFDVDRNNVTSTNPPNWQDRVVIRGYDKNDTLVYPALFINPSTASGNPGHQFYNGAVNDIIATANDAPATGAPNSAAGNIGVTFTQPIVRFEIDYYNGPDAKSSSDPHAIALIGSIQFCAPPYDFGDAPDTYLTLNSSNGAKHLLNDALRLGATAPDAENDAAAPLNGSGDDNNNINDEDTVTITGLTGNTSNYSLDVPVTNTSGFPATLVGWIDFDQDGIFQTDEGRTALVSDGFSGNVQLSWSGIGSSGGPNITVGDTYARFRLTTDTITTANPGGSLGGGEVEDYFLTIGSAIASDPNLILVKRITALIPGDGGATTTYSSFVDNGVLGTADPDNDGTFGDEDNNPNWPGYNPANGHNAYTVGVTGLDAVPGDIVEYTIYFLNTGDGAATAVKMCDLLSQYLTYIPNSYDGQTPNDGGVSTNLGIELNFAGTTVYLSGVAGDGTDRGEFVGANVTPTGCVVEDLPNSGTFRDALSGDNQKGTVVVNLSSVNPATGIGTPNTSYGYFRFRTLID